MFERVIFGGGIAALIRGWLTKTPVFYSHLSPPPLCTDLLCTKATRDFMSKSLGMKYLIYEIPHLVYWEGSLIAWPGTSDSNAAYLKKSRLRDEKPNGFYAEKAAIECYGILPLGQLFFELYQRLKMCNLLHQRQNLRFAQLSTQEFVFADDFGCRFASIELAMPPEFLGIRAKNAEEDVRILHTDVFSTVFPLPAKYIYVPDDGIDFFRAIKLSDNMCYVEHTKRANEERIASLAIMADLAHVVQKDVGLFKHMSVGVSPGYYNREYSLPEGISLIGRAATGKPLATHHLIEEYDGLFG